MHATFGQHEKQIFMAVYLGEFEELVLLTVAALGVQAYGAAEE